MNNDLLVKIYLFVLERLDCVSSLSDVFPNDDFFSGYNMAFQELYDKFFNGSHFPDHETILKILRKEE